MPKPRRWTDDHGAPGLRDKFSLYKTKTRVPHDDDDVTDLYWSHERIGADGEFIFVLRPETDRAAASALLAYAIQVTRRDPQLADEIRAKVRAITETNADV